MHRAIVTPECIVIRACRHLMHRTIEKNEKSKVKRQRATNEREEKKQGRRAVKSFLIQKEIVQPTLITTAAASACTTAIGCM